MAPSRKQHQQNQFGLSFNGMIVLAIRNSDTAIKSEFCNRAASIKDIYTFLKTHISPFRDMKQKEWNKCERVIRHSLSQTTYFHRFQIDHHGSAKIIPSKSAGAEKGSLWTMFPAPGEDKESAHRRIKKVFKAEHIDKFQELLFNPTTVDNLLNGTHGWLGPNGEPLGPSDAKHKLEKQLAEADADAYEQQATCMMAAGTPSIATNSAKRQQKERKAKYESESEEDDEDAPFPHRTYTLRKRKVHQMAPHQREAIEGAPPKKAKVQDSTDDVGGKIDEVQPDEAQLQVVSPCYLLEDEVAMAYYGLTWNEWNGVETSELSSCE